MTPETFAQHPYYLLDFAQSTGRRPPRPSLDAWALELAAVTAKRATCLRRAVGCVLLNRRGHVVGTGYNGRAAGQDHCNELLYIDGAPMHPHACAGADAPSGKDLDNCQAIHAEANALLQCHDVWDIYAAYVTVSPCVWCCRLLLNTSCERLVFAELYAHAERAQEEWQGQWHAYRRGAASVDMMCPPRRRTWEHLKG